MNQKQLFITFAILMMALLVGACNTASAGPRTAPAIQIPEITIKAADYSFDAPAQIEAGLVQINLVNDGQEPHHAQIVRLNDGVTLEQFQAALPEGEATFSLITFVGGPGLVDPGLDSHATLELTPGQYVLLCFIPSHDGVPHLAKGMVRPIEVVARNEADNPAALQVDAGLTVNLRDFNFPLPSKIKAGQQVWQILNEGNQPHEIEVVKLDEGKTMEDVQAFLHNPNGVPPFTSIGGFQAITPGESGWLNLNLEPGEYVALCYVPNPETGKPHFDHGMIQHFSVS